MKAISKRLRPDGLEDLVRRAKEDEQAFSELLERCRPLLNRAVREARRWPLLDLDDASQEARMALWVSVQRYRPLPGKCSFLRFAQRLIQRRLCDEFNRAYRHHAAVAVSLDSPFGPDGVELGDVLSDPASSPEEVAEAAVKLHRAVGVLQPIERRMVVAAAQGMKIREIADLCGVTPKKVDNTLCKARKRMRAAVGGGDIHE